MPEIGQNPHTQGGAPTQGGDPSAGTATYDIGSHAGNAKASTNTMKIIDTITLASSSDAITSSLNTHSEKGPIKQYISDSTTPSLEDPEQETQVGSETIATIRPFKRADKAVILHKFSQEFGTEVFNYANQQTPPLAKDQIKKIIYAQEHPEDPSTDPKTKAIVKQLSKKAAQTIREKYSLPPTWTPSSTTNQDWTPTTSYLKSAEEKPYTPEQQQEIITAFKNTIQEKVQRLRAMEQNAYNPPLSEQDLADIAQLAENPLSKEVHNNRPEVRELAKKIREEALNQTRATFGLPDSWKPTSKTTDKWTPVTIKGILPQEKARAAADDMINNVMRYLNENKDALIALSNSLAKDHPGQISIADFMKAITEALQEFKQFLYSHQTESNTKWVKAFTDERIAAIHQQAADYEKNMKAQEAAKKKQEKMKKLKIGMYVLGALLAVVGILAAVFTGGTSALLVAVAVTLISTAISVADSQTGFMSKGITDIVNGMASVVSDAAKAFGSPIDEQTAKIIAGAVLLLAVLVVAIALTVASGGSSAETTSSAVADVAATTSKTVATSTAKAVAKTTTKAVVLASSMAIVSAVAGPIMRNFVLSCLEKCNPNMSEEMRQIIAMIFSLLLTLACGAMSGAVMSRGMSSINAVKTASTTAQDTASQATTDILNNVQTRLQQLSSQSKKLLTAVFDKTIIPLNIGISVTQASLSFSLAVLLIQQGDLERRMGDNNADLHAMQALVKLLDKLLQYMQDTVGDEVKVITTISDVQANMYSGASAALNKGWRATQQA